MKKKKKIKVYNNNCNNKNIHFKNLKKTDKKMNLYQINPIINNNL